MPVVIEKHFPDPSKVKAVLRAEEAAALRDVGGFVRSKAAKYPAKTDSASYKRTGTLGRSIAVGTPQAGYGGMYVEVGTNIHYAKYVEYGTGIYGPRGTPIKPKTAKVLAWRSTGRPVASGFKVIAMGIRKRKGKISHNKAKDTYMNFAMEVKGMRPWHFMQKAFEDPASAEYFKARVAVMFQRVQAQLG